MSLVSSTSASIHYLAIFLPVEKDDYFIYFPDFPDIVQGIASLGELMTIAQAALSSTIKYYANTGRKLPVPSTLREVRELARCEMLDENIDTTRPPLFMLFGVPVGGATLGR
ncbi:MAG: type II toxin-antitoxin system HicB family antitoxin [Bilophila sp.]